MALPDFGIVDGQDNLTIGNGQFDRPAALGGNGRYPVNGRSKAGAVHFQFLVIADRNDTVVIREGAVDQLGRQHHIANGQADLGLGNFK